MAILLLGWPALAQEQCTRLRNLSETERQVLVLCGALPSRSVVEWQTVRSIVRRLGPTESEAKVLLVESDSVNAWKPDSPDRQYVCVSTALVEWERDSEDELAFVIAHELGHANDDSCKSTSGRQKLASKSHSIASLLAGSSNGDERSDQRRCEARADAFGLELMVRAGYDPNAAIRFFERLQELTRDKRKGWWGRLRAINDEHPLTSDRIKNTKKLLRTLQAETPATESTPKPDDAKTSGKE